MNRSSLVTSTDVALLRALAEERSVARASRRLGISRDRAVYRISRLARAFGGPVVDSVRGGTDHGGTVLTRLGDRIVRGGFESVEMLDAHPVTPLEPPNLLHGTFHRTPVPEVRVGRALRLRVAFDAEEGVPVSLLLDPESVVVARERFASSARNVLSGRLTRISSEGEGRSVTLVVRCSGTTVRVTVTRETVRQLGLAPGTRVWLYVKATALRRVSEGPGPTPGSPRS